MSCGNSSAGKVCFSVDKEVRFDVCVFSHCLTESGSSDLFKITPNDGIIQVSSDIDREVVGDSVTLTVKVHFSVFFSVCALSDIYYTYILVTLVL